VAILPERATMQTLGFDTKAVHGATLKQDAHNAIRFPIYAGAAFSFESAEEMEDSFAYRKPAHVYSRISNPTVEAFERKINLLEGGRGAIAVASGMAAISNVLFNLLSKGENIVAASSLFGNTYSFLKNTLKHFGIDTRFVDIEDLEQIDNSIDNKTRVVFLETISNPKMNVPEIAKIVQLAHKKRVVVVMDGTMTTPFIFNSKEFGVDVVIHSSTKLISGGSTSIGGVIVDLGNDKWSGFSSLQNYEKLHEWAFLARLRKEVHRNLGACMSPHTAYLHNLGLETLSLRMEKICENALKIARFLEENNNVIRVNYPGLASSSYHELAKNQFNGRYGGVLSFELRDKPACFQFLNQLKIIRRASNLGDNTSLIIHPASTIFREFTHKEKSTMGVTEEMIRLSIGIENLDDLLEDIKQALNKI
jgi:O-acetylhomoserine (thiol)-lyase